MEILFQQHAVKMLNEILILSTLYFQKLYNLVNIYLRHRVMHMNHFLYLRRCVLHHRVSVVSYSDSGSNHHEICKIILFYSKFSIQKNSSLYCAFLNCFIKSSVFQANYMINEASINYSISKR